jgi:heme exporter protein A
LTALLAARELALIRGERCLFKDVAFALNAGELLLIEGANGAGKTSLLRLIAGLLHADAGDVFWRGRAVRDCAQEFRGNLVWLAHKTGCKDDLTLADNLRFESALRPASSHSFRDVLEQLGLAHLAGLPMRSLSAGQQRRVSLARLLLSDAALWLMDEPYTNLDRDGQALVGALIAAHLGDGGACIVATHQSLSLDVPQQRLLLS